VEFAGFSNDLTNLADSRTDQSGQAIAQPYNIFSPVNPLTCTQVRTHCTLHDVLCICVPYDVKGKGAYGHA
jgi:hypothetical protein